MKKIIFTQRTPNPGALIKFYTHEDPEARHTRRMDTMCPHRMLQILSWCLSKDGVSAYMQNKAINAINEMKIKMQLNKTTIFQTAAPSAQNIAA